MPPSSKATLPADPEIPTPEMPSGADVLVPVFPSRRVVGWAGPSSETTPPTVQHLPLRDALSRPFSTDAHFAAYSLPDFPYRLRKGVVGAIPVPMIALILDIDGHKYEGLAFEEWMQREAAQIALLQHEHPGTYAHRTRQGYRLVSLLREPFIIRSERDAAGWKRFYLYHGLYLAYEFGIEFDPACADWTRLFRLPHATREQGGSPEEYPSWGNLHDISELKVGAFSIRDAIEIAQFLAAQFARMHPEARQNPWKSAIRLVAEERPTSHQSDPNPQSGGLTRRAAVALERESQAVSTAPTGNRNVALNRAAFRLGRYIPAGELNRHDVERALFDAAKANGLLADSDVPSVRATIASGLEAGRRESPAPLRSHSNDRAGGPNHPQRRRIRVGTDEEKTAKQGIRALVEQRAPIFQRCGMLVDISEDQSRLGGVLRPRDAPTARTLPTCILQQYLASCADWEKFEDGKLYQIHPPTITVRQIEAQGAWPGIRHLEAIVETPVLRPDGTVLAAPGYDERSGLLLRPNCRVGHIPERPTQEEAAHACSVLLEPVIDFPFLDPAHRAAWLAAPLTLAGRYAIAGPTPLTLIEAPIRGTGKTLLAKLIARMMQGRDPWVMPPASDDAEERKRLLAIALQAERMVLIDNVTHLGSPGLDAALTATTWSDRILGQSEVKRVPFLTVCVATGNNVVLRGDIVRRVNWVRLSPDCERPENRSGFRHSDVLAWTDKNRGRLVAAALTVLRAYFAAGKPNLKLKSWGSYEAYTDIIRSALVFAGQPDPYETRAQLDQQDDTRDAELAVLVGWRSLAVEHGDERGAVGAATAAGLLARDSDTYANLLAAISMLTKIEPGKSPTARQLGYLFRRVQGRIVGGLRLEKAPPSAGETRWFVRSVVAGPDGGDGGHALAQPALPEAGGSAPSAPSAPEVDDE